MFGIFGTNYKVGDVVRQDIAGGARLVLVTARSKDIKNDMPGFDGVLCDERGNAVRDRWGSDVWGYDYEVTEVVKRA